MSVLKAQLFELEKNADTLERIVYNALTALMTVKDRDVERYEDQILKKLEKLDELQEQIDRLTAELKARGEYEPVKHSANIYEYRPPRTPTVAYESKRKQKAGIGKVRPKTAWDSFSAMLGDAEEFTFTEIATKLDTDAAKCRAHVQHWRNKGYIEQASKNGRVVTYRRLKAN